MGWFLPFAGKGRGKGQRREARLGYRCLTLISTLSGLGFGFSGPSGHGFHQSKDPIRCEVAGSFVADPVLSDMWGPRGVGYAVSCRRDGPRHGTARKRQTREGRLARTNRAAAGARNGAVYSVVRPWVAPFLVVSSGCKPAVGKSPAGGRLAPPGGVAAWSGVRSALARFAGRSVPLPPQVRLTTRRRVVASVRPPIPLPLGPC